MAKSVMELQQMCYLLYKIDWLANHSEPTDIRKVILEGYHKKSSSSIEDAMKFIEEYGISETGECFVSMDEFLYNEFCDEEYMHELLGMKPEIYEEYNNYLIHDDEIALVERVGNLLEDDEVTLIVHQTNCFGNMGGGIAKQIANKYPYVADKDRKLSRIVHPENILGRVDVIRLIEHKETLIANLYSQYEPVSKEGVVYTDYNAMRSGLLELYRNLVSSPEGSDLERARREVKEFVIGFPKLIGCGLAGGDWNKVRSILNDFAKDCRELGIKVVVDEYVPN